MRPAPPPPGAPAKPVHWGVLGVLLGGFLGILAGKFALGLIFGFFIGLMIASAKRKSATSNSERPPGNDSPGP